MSDCRFRRVFPCRRCLYHAFHGKYRQRTQIDRLERDGGRLGRPQYARRRVVERSYRSGDGVQPHRLPIGMDRSGRLRRKAEPPLRIRSVMESERHGRRRRARIRHLAKRNGVHGRRRRKQYARTKSRRRHAAEHARGRTRQHAGNLTADVQIFESGCRGRHLYRQWKHHHRRREHLRLVRENAPEERRPPVLRKRLAGAAPKTGPHFSFDNLPFRIYSSRP